MRRTPSARSSPDRDRRTGSAPTHSSSGRRRLPGRALPDLVNTQPGWLLEANGILHPRGSEYQTQYVVDGLPLTDNRSPAFAPEFGADDVQAMNILTGGYPAEYGRKLGGVIEVVTTSQNAPRVRRQLCRARSGSFGTGSGDAIDGVRTRSMVDAERGGVARRDRRYLDPPVEENFTNHGSTTNGSLHVERDLSNVGPYSALIVRRRSSPTSWCRTNTCSRRPGSGRTATATETARPVLLPAHLFAEAARRRPRHGARSVRRSLVQCRRPRRSSRNRIAAFASCTSRPPSRRTPARTS